MTSLFLKKSMKNFNMVCVGLIALALMGCDAEQSTTKSASNAVKNSVAKADKIAANTGIAIVHHGGTAYEMPFVECNSPNPEKEFFVITAFEAPYDREGPNFSVTGKRAEATMRFFPERASPKNPLPTTYAYFATDAVTYDDKKFSYSGVFEVKTNGAPSGTDTLKITVDCPQ